MGSYMEIFEARGLGENLSFWLKNQNLRIVSCLRNNFSIELKLLCGNPCLLKLSRKQDTIIKIGDFLTKN
jgi:hypothetical protein